MLRLSPRIGQAEPMSRGKLSGPGFERLTAPAQIQLATTMLGVPVAVPRELTELEK
jgi:hypothetical protein